MSLVIAAALPWSLSLAILGLWMMLNHHPTGVLASRGIAVSAGLSALAAGQLVFLMCIADRVFVRVPAVLTRTIESILGAILLVGTLVLSVTAVGGGIG